MEMSVFTLKGGIKQTKYFIYLVSVSLHIPGTTFFPPFFVGYTNTPVGGNICDCL